MKQIDTRNKYGVIKSIDIQGTGRREGRKTSCKTVSKHIVTKGSQQHNQMENLCMLNGVTRIPQTI